MSDLIDPRDARAYKWHITPHPYNRAFDEYVTNDDAEALGAARHAIETAWDQLEPGEERTVTIRMWP